MNKNISYHLGHLGIAERPLPNGAIGLANEAAFDNTFLSQPLTQYTVGWMHSQDDLLALLEFVAPEVRAARRFEYRKANDKDAFIMTENDEDVRALYGEFKRIQSTGEIVQGKTKHKGLSKLIDRDEVKDDPMVLERAAADITKALIRAEIFRAISILSGAATSANKTWTTGADADIDILAAISAGGDSAGLDPNRILFGQAAWQRRIQGLRALDTAGGFATNGFGPEELAAWLGIDGVKISKERYQRGTGKSALVTSNIMLAFNAQSGGSKDDPSNIKRFVSLNEGNQFRVYQRDIASDLIEVTVSHYSLIALTSSSGVRKITVS